MCVVGAPAMPTEASLAVSFPVCLLGVVGTSFLVELFAYAFYPSLTFAISKRHQLRSMEGCFICF